MHSVRVAILCAALLGPALHQIAAAAEDQPVPPVYVDPEDQAEDEALPEQPAVHCEGQNCLPPEDNPAQECEGQNCAPAPEILKVD